MRIFDELKKTLEHPNYQKAVSECNARATFMMDGNLLIVVGPTRVGKSRAVREALRMMYKPTPGNEFQWLDIDAATTDGGFISTRYLTLKMLTKLEHPFYVGDEHGLRLNNTETTARIRLVKAIEHRGTKLILIDEAHHLLRTKSTRSAVAALDSIKCLGNETGAKIVLVGSYELLSACFASAHLNGRLSLVEFQRYGPTERGMENFHRLLASLDPILPWARGESLLNNWKFIHDGTLGCYGLLESWVLSALASMTSNRSTRLTREHFKQTRFQQQLDPIAAEIALGEDALSPIAVEKNVASEGAVTRKRRSKPGRRAPKRDPVH